MVWLRHPAAFTLAQVRPLGRTVFPVNIAQSCLTTGLITFKIWNQHRRSQLAGLSTHGSGVGLLTIVRIIIESSMIFTAQQVVLCILYYMDSPLQYIFHGTLVPSIGTSIPWQKLFDR